MFTYFLRVHINTFSALVGPMLMSGSNTNPSNTGLVKQVKHQQVYKEELP